MGTSDSQTGTSDSRAGQIIFSREHGTKKFFGKLHKNTCYNFEFSPFFVTPKIAIRWIPIQTVDTRFSALSKVANICGRNTDEHYFIEIPPSGGYTLVCSPHVHNAFLDDDTLHDSSSLSVFQDRLRDDMKQIASEDCFTDGPRGPVNVQVTITIAFN